MFYSKIIQKAETSTFIHSLWIAFVVVLFVGIPGMCRASAENKSSLWTYNDKKADKPMDLQGIQTNLQEIQNTMDELQHQTTPFFNKCESFTKANSEVQKELQRLSHAYEIRQKEMEELEKQIADMKTALELKLKHNSGSSQSVEELQNKLKEAEGIYNELNDKKTKLIDNITRSEKQDSGRSVNKPAVDMMPVYVLIYDNRIVPIEDPYYKLERVFQINNGQFVSAVQATRVKDGEPVSEAIQSGGCLDSLLSKVDAARKYVMFLVCPDSISAFRIAASKTKEHNIQYAWSPGQDEILYGSSGGTSSDWPTK